jgi:hypothetical protein|tara:strand:+ start:10631 stop:10834 length:204 start_codon:yes stop_codon:yes gene_type:complete
MTYLEHADLRVTQYLGDLKELLFDVIDGKADSKEASDCLGLLEEIQEEFTIVSNSLKESDKLLGSTI